jgi:hypothetical protein
MVELIDTRAKTGIDYGKRCLSRAGAGVISPSSVMSASGPMDGRERPTAIGAGIEVEPVRTHIGSSVFDDRVTVDDVLAMIERIGKERFAAFCVRRRISMPSALIIRPLPREQGMAQQSHPSHVAQDS